MTVMTIMMALYDVTNGLEKGSSWIRAIDAGLEVLSGMGESGGTSSERGQ